MGNNKFKFSDMIPNAWFYKLKDMSKSKKRNGSHVMKSKVTSPTTSQMSHSSCRVSSSTNDIIIDMMNNNESFHGNCEKIDDFDAFSTIGLAPILTKQVKFDDKIKWAAPESRNSTDSDEPEIDHSFSMKVNIEGSNHRSQRRKKKSQIVRKSSPNSPGIRLRVNSPKIGNRKIQACARKSVSSSSKGSKDSRNDARFLDGFAVVKSSIDPQSDFKESMVEMIVENNIRESKDLEDLLACYLSLNSSEYHDLIVKAFEQIWYDMAQLRM
ncbi:transcription repressor OFP4 isoform X2 [Cicer arietinum]|uniref:transcription repressor OFP4 isoform X2 n=1 Tax=Cicer arietinum TaxID=3827 RepID=UPI0006412A93